jgi:hypothetical protein
LGFSNAWEHPLDGVAMRDADWTPLGAGSHFAEAAAARLTRPARRALMVETHPSPGFS